VWKSRHRRAARHDDRDGARPGDGTARWVVLDVEASGLDAAHDRLLAIAAVAVHTAPAAAPRIAVADSFEVVLRQPDAVAAPDKPNILLHGIGVGAQRAGIEPAAALEALAGFVGEAPLLAFHAAFDRTLIERAFAGVGRPRPRNAWLDLEPLAAVLHPDVAARSLDEWMAHFRIRCALRHEAAADALATAELLLRLWRPLLAQLGTPSISRMRKLAAQRRWLRP
jgi:DNA polymerase-3 subunit epsilon